MIKLIALDMDGTLLNDDRHVSPYTKEMIQRAQEKGIPVILSTGRPFEKCKDYMDELNLTSYTITANGAQIYSPHREVIVEKTMDASIIERLTEIGNKVEAHMWYITIDDVMDNNIDIQDFSAYQWLKMGYNYLNEEQKETILDQLRTIENIEITNSLPTNIEVNGQGINKAKGLEFVCDKLEIQMEEVLAVGDSMNDYEMLKHVGVGVAMDNAQKTIKKIADDQTLDNNQDGVGLAIKKHVLDI